METTQKAERQIEEQLQQELQKLRKAVEYIEEAKEASANSGRQAEEVRLMHTEIIQIGENVKSILEQVKAAVAKDLKDEKQSYDLEYKKLYDQLQDGNADFKYDIRQLKQSYAILKMLCYASLGISVFLLIRMVL